MPVRRLKTRAQGAVQASRRRLPGPAPGYAHAGEEAQGGAA
eukprot:CAMPEP_0184115576 /NCGR_PEP_ID=MMETSP0974-20121125/20000_1 /TAXON_ID=483370 /ORGANISM="non described non described, Strain CCMP2097" /LENGTH=40 /DNA_ID= /DNA_START= /DNA_END= /DNA_ORIENTATION=